MKRCTSCGSVYTHKSIGNEFCAINCFKFYHNDGDIDGSIHQIISKLKDYNDEVPELDTMDKVFTYKEHQALVDQWTQQDRGKCEVYIFPFFTAS